jgi:hypothetical protein
MLYLYGVMPKLRVTTPLPPGLNGHSVRLLPWCDLMGVTSPIDRWTVVANESAVWCHDRVIEALMATATILPMRFGRVVADDDACLRLLIHHSRSLRSSLKRLENCVEFGLRLAGLPPETGNAGDAESAARTGPGQVWLRHRIKAAHRRSLMIEKPLHDHLDPHVTACAIWPSRSEESLLRASVLVRRDTINAFLVAVAALQRQLETVTVDCTGPWPPYSFSDSHQLSSM